MPSTIYFMVRKLLYTPACKISNARTRDEVSQKNRLDFVSFILGDLRDGKSKINDCAPLLSSKRVL